MEDTNATAVDTASDVVDTSATIEDTNAEIVNTSARIVSQCGPAPLNYRLQLFENTNPSDGIASLNQELRAVASTDDSSVDQITFRWIRPSTEIAREVTVPISTPEDTFAPDEPGVWLVEADFGNG
ncbi:MAG: hypothetical protein ACREBU_04215 [Nitrososphaera sp.]